MDHTKLLSRNCLQLKRAALLQNTTLWRNAGIQGFIAMRIPNAYNQLYSALLWPDFEEENCSYYAGKRLWRNVSGRVPWGTDYGV